MSSYQDTALKIKKEIKMSSAEHCSENCHTAHGTFTDSPISLKSRTG
jgi:hypothetical protein